MRLSQESHFPDEMALLKTESLLPRGSSLLPLHPFVDSDSVLRVGGRERNSIHKETKCSWWRREIKEEDLEEELDFEEAVEMERI